MTRRTLSIAVGVLFAALLLQAGAAGAEWVWPPSEEVMDAVEANLSRHYESGKLRAYLENAGAEQREALEFLLAWLPPSDLGALPAETLIENVETALEAWHEAPWRDEIDPYIFHTYVLPHRVTQEPVQRWRPRLRELTAPRVASMDLGTAALEINRLAREWVTYEPSSRRDQGPLTTMERGIGRCEEEMIFAICALRSAGVPARYCAVPCWCTGDGNHAWTEVYTGREEGWRYIGSCEPAACLDQAWFTNSARRTGTVLSAGYGEAPVPEEYAETLYKQADGVTTLNSIGVYSDPGTLVLAFPDGHEPRDGSGEAPEGSDKEVPDGTADEPAEAHVHTFNWGGAQPLLSQPLGSEVLLGPGDYLVTAELDSAPWSALVTILSGQRTALALAPDFGVLEQPVWLRYPLPVEDGKEGCSIEEDDPVWLRHQRDIARRDLDRSERSRPSHEWVEVIAGRPEAGELSRQIELAGPLTGDWTSSVLALTGDTLDVAVDLLLEMDIKDFYEMDTEDLPAVLGEVVRVKDATAVVPDSLWGKYVLSPRLYFQEGTMRWWTDLPWLGADTGAPAGRDLLSAFRERVSRLEATQLGAIATPEDTWRSGHASPPSARACLVGLLRRHGIAARAGMGVDYVEAWEDDGWTRLVPFEEDEPEDAETGDAPPEEGYLAVRYFDQDAPLTNVETWRQTRLTRFKEGHFQTWYLGQLSEGDGLVQWSLAPDEYWLFGGLRNPRGEPRFVARRVVVAPGDSVRFDLDVGIPLDEWEPADLVQREWDPDTSLEVTRGDAVGNLSDVADGVRLLVLTLSGHEASFRHLSALSEVDWEALNVAFIPVEVAGLADHPPGTSSATISAELAESIFGVKNPKSHLPLTILLDESDGTLVWFRGLRHDMAEHLQRVLDNR
ncbi:MAG: transglutaminase-like domain-containing protein [Candidatus Eisenbacteria bacterium]